MLRHPGCHANVQAGARRAHKVRALSNWRCWLPNWLRFCFGRCSFTTLPFTKQQQLLVTLPSVTSGYVIHIELQVRVFLPVLLLCLKRAQVPLCLQPVPGLCHAPEQLMFQDFDHTICERNGESSKCVDLRCITRRHGSRQKDSSSAIRFAPVRRLLIPAVCCQMNTA